jgi:4-amino-4-deoxy-L-arabinose transferase-like glycosyltransferase
VAILLAYLALGTLYALFTPAWQAPDEPAHFNYVQYLAGQHRFPILKPGDYPAAYLEEIKAAQFSPEMSIEPIRYEFHQPPLYYLLVLPVYQLFGGALLPLRLVSLGLGGALLLVAYWTVQALAPGQPILALGTTAFIAFLPMHVAMTAAANNDTLAELLLATILLLSIRYLRASTQLSGEASTDSARNDIQLLVLLGITTGLGLVTKSSVYIALPLVLATILARQFWLDGPTAALAKGLRDAALYLLPALALALPWWLRNVALYGGLDFLGLGRHDQVVAGQLRTAEFIAANGMAQLVRDFSQTSFRSFWGQFGWMGVLLDERLYQAVAVLTALALLGFVLWFTRAWQRRRQAPDWQWAAGGLLALTLLLTLATYFWYNTNFLQHQGRYLFRALVPIGLAVAVGWREVLRRKWAALFAVLLLAGAVVLRVAGLLPAWPLLMFVATSAAFALRRILPTRWDPVIHAVPYVSLILLALISLFFFVVPQLTA